MTTYRKPYYRIEHYMIMNDNGEERVITDKQNVSIARVNSMKLKARKFGFKFNRKTGVYEKQKNGYLECIKYS